MSAPENKDPRLDQAAVTDAHAKARPFFEALGGFLPRGDDDRLALDRALRAQPAWAEPERLWTALDDKQAYVSPMDVTLAGVPQYLVVSATRLRSVADLDVPASVTTVVMDPDNNRMQSNMTELLAGLPGVTALDRQNYAQDTQLSIRGYGSRATFGATLF